MTASRGEIRGSGGEVGGTGGGNGGERGEVGGTVAEVRASRRENEANGGEIQATGGEMRASPFLGGPSRRLPLGRGRWTIGRMHKTVFSRELRLVLCPRCGAPIEGAIEGGTVAC